ncbi:MAG: Rpn family recombination-promoting nuclease/putative transposase [Desulfococcaceae bacterium]
MQPLLSPKNDYVFKKLFTSDAEILTDLINHALGRSGPDRIVSVEIRNPEIPPEEIEKKFIVLDIRAADESGHEFDIEMQIRRYEDYPKRTLYYLCRMYGEQLGAGEPYAKLHPVVGIHFLDYAFFHGGPDFHYHFSLRDVRHPHLALTDDLSLHIFRLPGIESLFQNRKADGLLEWLHFFSHPQSEGENGMPTQYKNPMVNRALDSLRALSADQKTRELAERREKAIKDEAMFLNEARKKGLEEGLEKGMEKGLEKGRNEGLEAGRKETALNLLRADLLSIDQIAGVTGLEKSEIEKLKRSLS